MYVIDSIQFENTQGHLLIDDELPIEIRLNLRGSSSLAYPKKSYSLSIKDTQISLLNLPVSNKWVLYAPYSDKTYLRNKLGYRIFNQMGNVSCQSAFAELYLNENYWGLYEVVQKQQSPVINHYDSSVLVIKIDKTSGKQNFRWASQYSRNLFFEFHYPSIKKLSTEVKTNAMRIVNDLERTIYSNPNKLNSIADESSFIDYFILQEICKSPDGFRSSVYFFITPDNKVHMGPLWDCDLAFGNCRLYNSYNPEGWRFEEESSYTFNAGNKIPKWWNEIYQNQMMREKIQTRWSILRKKIINSAIIDNWLDSMSNAIKTGIDQDQIKWGTIGRKLKWNYYTGENVPSELNYLKWWIKKRINWMDKQLEYNSTMQ